MTTDHYSPTIYVVSRNESLLRRYRKIIEPGCVVKTTNVEQSIEFSATDTVDVIVLDREALRNQSRAVVTEFSVTDCYTILVEPSQTERTPVDLEVDRRLQEPISATYLRDTVLFFAYLTRYDHLLAKYFRFISSTVQSSKDAELSKNSDRLGILKGEVEDVRRELDSILSGSGYADYERLLQELLA